MVFVIQLAKQLAQMDFIRKTILQKAFDLIDTNVSAFCLCSLGHTCTISLSSNSIYQDFYCFAVDIAFLPFCVRQGQGYLSKEQCLSLLDELNKYR